MRTRRQSSSEEPEDGRCRVCGREGPLTFEHLPPSSAGNEPNVRLLGLEDWLRREEHGESWRRGKIQQRGSGAYSLCKTCNDRGGVHYVPELARWVHAIGGGLAGSSPPLEQIDAQLEDRWVTGEMRGVKPARFLKQVVTMLLALSPGSFPPVHPALMEYARDPQRVGLPERYQFYLAAYCGPTARYCGGAARLRFDQERSITDFVLELAFPPFSYVLAIDSDPADPPVRTCNISNFAQLSVSDVVDVDMQLQVGFGHTPFPLDYRTKAAHDRDVAFNQRAAS